MPVTSFSGLIAGYDPGGNNCHGVALAQYREGVCESLTVKTVTDVEAVLKTLDQAGQIKALGIDTLTYWSTGESGWRPADFWLRKNYRSVQHSVVSPNSLFGSMGVNGMAVLLSLKEMNPTAQITETHPKVLYWALAGRKYNYPQTANEMDAVLSEWLGVSVSTENDHEWDALISVFAAFMGITGIWRRNLLEEPAPGDRRLLFPAGPTHYWWPE